MGQQTRKDSAIETLTQLFVGYIVALLIQMTILPYYGCTASFLENAAITATFTAASLIRGYAIRRLFSKSET